MTNVVELARSVRLDYMSDDDVLEALAEHIRQAERERIANQIDRMPFGDTAASFAIWIREGAP